MNKEIQITSDGSTTLYIPELEETYHSSHGAVQEAIHVFIENGLQPINQKDIAIFEMGFGTGLNALLTLAECHKSEKRISYSGIEAYPVPTNLIDELNYSKYVDQSDFSYFKGLHEVEWGESVRISDFFQLEKIHAKIEDYEIPEAKFDLVYYDAFGPRAQNDMWGIDVLKKMYKGLKVGGVLVTYCAQGQFKRNIKALGFEIESLPGPPGKREMTRATKV